MRTDLDPRNYYRLPWNLNDNVLGWLEPTKRCNLYCEGCYSRNDPASDKSLAQIRADLEVFTKNRTMDSISIAGGDPLVHPDIVEIVRMVRHEFGLKPILNTNALALTPEFLRDLKRAGVFGFTFHIDSGQVRKGWKGKSELELCELRLHYAEMVAAEGGLSVAFNSTVYPHTVANVPDLMQWAQEHIDIVHSMVFILFRTTRSGEFDYYVAGNKINTDELVYYDQDKNPKPLVAQDVVKVIRERFPDYDPCAYLGGTHDPQSFKWLLAGRMGTKKKVHGYVGPKYMEVAQSGHHALFNRYLAYSSPDLLKHGRSTSLLASSVDPGARAIAKSYLGDVLKNPLRAAERMYFQTLLVIQPIDMMGDGATNMCDGCPDMTVSNGELVWSCRLDERLEHGCWLSASPKCGVVGKKRRLPTVPPASSERSDEESATRAS